MRKRGEGHLGERRGKGRSRDFCRKQSASRGGWERTVPRWGNRVERLRVTPQDCAFQFPTGRKGRVFQRAANLSPRGAVFAHTVPRSPGSRVRVRFTLPGEADPVLCEGEIVAAEEGDNVGVRFLDLSPDVRRRIARLVAGRA